MTFILFQLLLRQSENLLTDQWWHGDLNPVLERPLAIRTIAIGNTIGLPQGAGDPLTGTDLCFSKACPPLVCRIAQHAPHGGPLPSRDACTSRSAPVLRIGTLASRFWPLGLLPFHRSNWFLQFRATACIRFTPSLRRSPPAQSSGSQQVYPRRDSRTKFRQHLIS